MPREFQLYIVSVDFVTTEPTGRPNPPYYELDKLLQELGGVLRPTHQVRLLLSPLKASSIRNKFEKRILENGDRIYVGKIAQ